MRRAVTLLAKMPPAPITNHLHIKARCESYPRDPEIKRFPVPDDKVPWDVMFPEYNPTNYTSAKILSNPPYADPDISTVAEPNGIAAKWNSLDGKIDRRSHHGNYRIVNNVPRNPIGRTGMIGRGHLGRWGPNHAADPIVTRWKRDARGNILKHSKTKRPLLEFIAIERQDSGEWAIPGGMVDPGETVTATLRREFAEEAMNFLQLSNEEKKVVQNNVRTLFTAGSEGMVTAGESVSQTLKREFSEETMNSLEATESEKKVIRLNVLAFFKGGTEVYRGYVDDPRNTDNAWMETVAVNFHDEKGESVAKFKLHAGDDAKGVMWHDMHSGIKLYASHVEFCEKVARRLRAHWQ